MRWIQKNAVMAPELKVSHPHYVVGPQEMTKMVAIMMEILWLKSSTLMAVGFNQPGHSKFWLVGIDLFDSDSSYCLLAVEDLWGTRKRKDDGI
ncbi:hypothetical protein ACLOJK_001924 [Asimina triloba]